MNSLNSARNCTDPEINVTVWGEWGIHRAGL